ncbi:MAG: cation:proton antiporter [Pseudomonadota bacterium]
MRRVLVLMGLLGLMLSLHALRVEGSDSAVDPLTLAAIGFVVLAAFTVGELATLIRLPRITGYILGGVALGPQISDVLSVRVVGEMSVFNTLALGLIATTAGLELDLKAVRRVWRTLAATLTLKIPLLLLFVGGTFFALEHNLPSLGIGDPRSLLALGLILATLGIGTSPAIALAVINESGARGRLSDLTLAIAVVKDLVVVLALAVALTAVRVLITPEASFGSEALLKVAEEVGGSLLIGGALGGLLILYLRFVHRSMLLAVVVAVLLTAELTAALHLELLLVFITAGFVVRNFSKHEHDLLRPLRQVSLPVFVVFFTTAGAGVDLLGTLRILPLAVALTLGRMLAFAVAGRLGARLGGEKPVVGHNAWLAYLPQAGVTLGLVFLAAAALPDLADPIRQTGMALVAINLLLGPIALGVALRRAGEVPGSEPATETAEPATAPPAATERLVDAASTPAGDASAPAPRPPALEREPVLAQTCDDLAARLDAICGQLADEVVEPLLQQGLRVTTRLFADLERKHGVAGALQSALASAHPDLAEGLEAELRRRFVDARALLDALPRELAVPMREELLVIQARDSLTTRWHKRLGRLGRRLRRRPQIRQVPLRIAAFVAYERRLAEVLEAQRDAWFRTHLAMLAQVQMLLHGGQDADSCRAEIGRITQRHLEVSRSDLGGVVRRGHDQLSRRLERLAAPGDPASSLRLSETATETAAALRRLDGRAAAWRRLIDDAAARLRASAELAVVSTTMRELLDARAGRPLGVVEDDILPLAEALLTRLDALVSSIDQATDPAARREVSERVQALFTRHDRNRLRGFKAKYRHAAQVGELRQELAQALENVPERLEILREDLASLSVVDPGALTPDEVKLARACEVILLEGLTPRIAEVLSTISELVVLGEERLEDAADSVAYGLDNKAEDASAEDWPETAREVLSRARERIASHRDELQAAHEAAREGLLQVANRAEESLRAITDDRSAGDRVRASARQTTRLVSRWLEVGRKAARRSYRRATGVALRATRRRGVRDWLIRSGQTRLDALDMAGYLRRFFAAPESFDLPRLYLRAFELSPVEDPRLMVAYRQEAEDLVRALLPSGSATASNALVVGAHGSGRSSLLNLAELRLARQRAVRLDARYHRRRDGVVGALAAELGVAASLRSIVQLLQRRDHVILIDDLEHYVLPTPEGVAELERFVELVVATSERTRWVVSIEAQTLALLQPLLPLGAAFGRRVLLRALSWHEIRELVETRLRLTGFELRFESRQVLGRTLTRWLQPGRDDYYKALSRAAGGNLRAAILGHLRHLQPVSEKALSTRMPAVTRIPFVDQIPPEAQVVLSLLLRFGPLRRDELGAALCRRADEVDAALLPLRDAGLVSSDGADEAVLVPGHLENAVAHALMVHGSSQEVL